MELTNKKFIIPKRAKPDKCKYCGKNIHKNALYNCCDLCRRKKVEGFFIIKKMREKNGIKS